MESLERANMARLKELAKKYPERYGDLLKEPGELRRFLDATYPSDFEQYQQGDCVLVSTSFFKTRHKANTPWIGPFQIQEVVAPDVYRLKARSSLVTNLDKPIHAHYLRYFSSASLEFNSSLEMQILYDAAMFYPDEIVQCGLIGDVPHVYVSWQGFPSHQSTWEPLRDYIGAYSQKVWAFLHKTSRAEGKQCRAYCKQLLQDNTIKQHMSKSVFTKYQRDL
jgi:hypothetical protein